MKKHPFLIAALLLVAFYCVTSPIGKDTGESRSPSTLAAVRAVPEPPAATTAAPRRTSTPRPTARPTATPAPAPSPTPSPARRGLVMLSASPSPSRAPRATAESTPEPGTKYVINTSTRKFHRPSCASVKAIKDSNRRDYFGTREEVIDMGYVPCKRCSP